MARDLLWRGLLAGLVAACLSALFALAFAEPRVDGAIAFEARHEAAAHAGMAMPAAEEIVSRATQKTAGLFTAMGLYGAAMGGLFALAFTCAYGRVGRIGPRTLALLLAIVAFVVITLVPAIKYPPTPPAVGLHETVRLRTAAFFAMIALSLLAAGAAAWMHRALLGRLDRLTALVAAGGVYVLLVAVFQRLLPMVDEVPADFPATLLWQFRLAAIGAQGVLWLALGLLFGTLAEQRLRAGTAG